MFENILHQTQMINQLKNDIENGTLSPSILFSGPVYAGKETTALELARVLSCENELKTGSWNCSCPSCIRHRNLVSPDLLLLGRRRFFEDIAASSDAFLRNPEIAGSRMLFFRSVRKLLCRFNSVLWEDDPRFGKLKNQIAMLEEELEDAENIPAETAAGGKKGELAKRCGSIVNKAAKLETDGLGEFTPIGHIRRAAYWSRLLPLGRHKCIVIGNAEKMQEGAKNSLLKILEEPPPHLTIILSSSRPKSLLPTILSRLREYRFIKRNADAEAEVIGRIFRDTNIIAHGENLIESYLVSFLPVSDTILYHLGAFFAASVAAEAIREKRALGRENDEFLDELLIDLGKFTAPIAEEGGMGRPLGNIKSTLEKMLGTAEGFEIPGLFIRFLQQCSLLISAWLRSMETNAGGAEKSILTDLWRRELNRSMAENDTFNISPFMALERLFVALKTGMI